MISLLLLLACAKPVTTPPETTPPGPPAEAAEAAPTRRVIGLVPSETTWDEAGGKAIFEPDRDRQKADYETYVLDLPSLMAALGGRPEATVNIEIEITRESSETYFPSDPNMPSPMGGFRTITYEARVVGKGPE